MRSSTQSLKTEPIIFLFGPTASGKTALVEGLFNSGYEVINADSVQVYRHLDIGSAKPSSELMARIPHHLVDVRDPWEGFSVGDFIHMADEAASQIRSRGNIPLVTGGTAFYFKHFLYGLSQAPTADASVRASVAKEMEERGNEAMHDYLASVDPVSAARINVNDGYRISRAIEVYRQSGRPLSSFALPDKPRKGMRPLLLNIVRERSVLARRIGLRVDEMFSMGLVDEVRSIVRMGGQASWPGLQGIGYSEFFRAFDEGCWSLDDIKKAICLDSRRYAKRQMTFFRSFEDVIDIDADDIPSVRSIVDGYLSTF